MKIVVAPDSFKESLSAAEACQAIARGVARTWPQAQCVTVPMADGGEGTTGAIVDALGGKMVEAQVVDALGRPRTAHFGWVEEERLAVIEVAQAIGIEHIAESDRDPSRSHTAGVGMLLQAALDLAPDQILVGLGGSATNDGGWGMCHHLGVRAYDRDGNPVGVEPLELARVTDVDLSGLDPRIYQTQILMACDVNNPLCGPRGASAIFGPQKGLRPEQVPVFDRALQQWGSTLEETTGTYIADVPGAGAAGGLGAAFMGVLGAEPRPGVDVVIETVGLADKIAGADLVLTGEGSLDGQTSHGKTPWGVMLCAHAQGVPTVAFAGKVGDDARKLLAGNHTDNEAYARVGGEALGRVGFREIIQITPPGTETEKALREASENLENAVAKFCNELTK